MKEFKVKWNEVYDGEPEKTYKVAHRVYAHGGEPLKEQDLKIQSKKREQLQKLLKKDGYILSHTDSEGFSVYTKAEENSAKQTA